MIGIYKITSPSGRIYIGQSVDIKKRIVKYRLLQCKSQTKLYRSFLKHGFENHKFEVIEKCNSDMLNERERHYQDLYDCTNRENLNCRLTTTKDKSGLLSEETKLKLRKAKALKPNYFKGKKHKPESIEKMRISSTGKRFSEAVKLKMSADRKGIRRTFGYKHSEESKKKISLSSKRNGVAKEHINFLHTIRRKIVLNTETGVFHDSVKEVSITYGLVYSTLVSHLNGCRLINRTNFIYA